MYFVTKVKFSHLLFKGLDIDTTGGMVGACVVTFLVAVLYEVLKLLKVYLILRLNENPLAQAQQPSSDHDDQDPINANTHDGVILLPSLRFPSTVHQIKTRKIMLHIFNSLSHTLNFFWGYIVMLLVMSYSVWLTIAVVTGLGTGYFVFGAMGEKLQKLYSKQMTPSAPCGGDEDRQRHHAAETVHM
ncbi:protein SLC31A2-like isoform X2 [Babylonia areolata]